MLPAGALPGPIAAAGGSIWVAQRDANVLTRMSTSGAITGTFALPAEHANPVGIAVVDDALWLAQLGTQSLVRADLGGAFTRELDVRSSPDALTAGTDGDLWYASADGRGVVGHVRLGG